jgi:hypothetical protein
MIFSQRHHDDLVSGLLRVELNPELRSELHALVQRYDSEIGIFRDPNSVLTDLSSTILFEVMTQLKADYGWRSIPGLANEARLNEEVQALMETLESHRTLDLLEELGAWLQGNAAVAYRQRLNEIIQRHRGGWTYSGSIFRLGASEIQTLS